MLRVYEVLYKRKNQNQFALTPFRIIVRLFAKLFIDKLLVKDDLSISRRTSDIIVSLTSFPARINEVHLVIRCLLRQSIIPSKIILWLSKDQFIGEHLPDNLMSLIGDVFEIRFVDGDIRSHKKYYYALKEFPSSRIFLVDDDIYYPSNMLELIDNESKLYPNHIICRYGSMAGYTNGKLDSYNKWWFEEYDAIESYDFFFGSGGGTLISQRLLYKDVLNIDLAQKLTPIADDIWLNAMVNLQGTPKRKVKCGLLLPNEHQQGIRLTAENVGNNQNDIQLKNIIDYYSTTIKRNPFQQKDKK